MLFKHLLIAAALAGSWPQAASAQVDMGSIPMWNTIGMLNQMNLDQALRSTTSGQKSERGSTAGDRAAKPRETASTQIPLGARRMPARMAQHYPVADRAEAERVFDNMLSGYGQIARQLGVPQNDVAGAVAAFIAGSWMAYHDKDVADADFPTLVAQMREVLRSTPEFVNAPVARKQDLYEQLAILGTTMALTRAQLQQQPNAAQSARMKAAAGSYLTGFLKMDPDKLVIDRNGLSTKA